MLDVYNFAKLAVPDNASGYTVDDNSRALIVSTTHDKLYNSEISKELSKIYLNFLEKVQDKDGKFNDMSYEERNLIPSSEDSTGRRPLGPWIFNK